ncbi:hypothetical protein Tco_0181987, partial [Tanacetum coccineum]
MIHTILQGLSAKTTTLNELVKKLEKGKKTRTYKLKRLYKVGVSRRVVSSEDEAILDDLAGDEVVVETEAVSKNVNLNEDGVTLAQTLQKMKSTTPREKKVAIREK